MKIKEIRAFEIRTEVQPKTKPRTPSRAQTIHMNRPMARYERFPDGEGHVSFATVETPGCTGHG